MLRWMTAGESHGQALAAFIEGIPAGVDLTTADVQAALARRRLGYGRGARMAFEQDVVTLLSGVRHGRTLGSPIAVQIANSEWPKWQVVMSADPVDEAEYASHDDIGAPMESGRNAPLTRPRPGHADLAGMQKYGHTDARPILERASARETAARVALGEIAARFLAQACGIRLVSHTVSVGDSTPSAGVPSPDDVAALDADPVRTLDAAASAEMVACIDAARSAGDTLGGVVEVLAYGVPAGLGSHTQWDRRLDARLAAALMSVQAIKGVEIGDGFSSAARPGTQAHDEMYRTDSGEIARRSDRAGGVEGGMSTGQPLRVRAAMKPISTVPRALATIDIADATATATAIHQRSDVCAVPAAGVVAEAMVALILAEAVLEKFGGDQVAETRRNHEAYLAAIPEAMRGSS